MKIACIAADDEPLALRKMEEYISKTPYLDLKGSFSKGFEVLEFIRENPVDLIFLDIQMEDISGIQVLKTLRNKPAVIVTTAFDKYALEGYELDVRDYLLKPISFERFLTAVEKIRDIRQELSKPYVPDDSPPVQPEYFFVKSDYQMQKIMLKEILFIEGKRNYVKFHLYPKRHVVSLMSFKKLEGLLPASRFIRIHKSFIVATDKIDAIGKSAVQVFEHSLPIGEAFREQFFASLERKGLIR